MLNATAGMQYYEIVAAAALVALRFLPPLFLCLNELVLMGGGGKSWSGQSSFDALAWVPDLFRLLFCACLGRALAMLSADLSRVVSGLARYPDLISDRDLRVPLVKAFGLGQSVIVDLSLFGVGLTTIGIVSGGGGGGPTGRNNDGIVHPWNGFLW